MIHSHASCAETEAPVAAHGVAANHSVAFFRFSNTALRTLMLDLNLKNAQIHGSRRSRLPNRVATGHPNGDALEAPRSQKARRNKAPAKLSRNQQKSHFPFSTDTRILCMTFCARVAPYLRQLQNSARTDLHNLGVTRWLALTTPVNEIAGSAPDRSR